MGPYDAIVLERHRQDRKWGVQNLTDAEFLCVLTEEVGEVAAAINDSLPVDDVRRELVQVAAVCVKWLEAIDRRGKQPNGGDGCEGPISTPA